jgi:hypothetical protein
VRGSPADTMRGCYCRGDPSGSHLNGGMDLKASTQNGAYIYERNANCGEKQKIKDPY